LALSTALRFEGKSTDEIKQIMDEKAEEAEQQSTMSEAILNSVISRTARENT
jgi:Cdc6-like AAA superfamily ATPase